MFSPSRPEIRLKVYHVTYFFLFLTFSSFLLHAFLLIPFIVEHWCNWGCSIFKLSRTKCSKNVSKKINTSWDMHYVMPISQVTFIKIGKFFEQFVCIKALYFLHIFLDFLLCCTYSTWFLSDGLAKWRKRRSRQGRGNPRFLLEDCQSPYLPHFHNHYT